MKKGFVFSLYLLLFAALTACGSDTANEKIQTEGTVKEETAESTASETLSSDPMSWNGIGQISGESAYVETPYELLYYPVEYADLLNVDLTEEEYYQVSFSGRSTVGDVFLFSVYFGREDKGELLGSVTDADGNETPVTGEVYTLSLDDRWSEQEKQGLEELKTEVYDYTVSHLADEKGFKPAD